MTGPFAGADVVKVEPLEGDGSRRSGMIPRSSTPEFRAAGIPVGAVRIKEEIMDDPQAWANEYFVHLEHETVGGVQLVGPPVKLSETPLVADRASPTLGKHSAEVLREAGLSEDDVAALISRGVVVAQEPAR